MSTVANTRREAGCRQLLAGPFVAILGFLGRGGWRGLMALLIGAGTAWAQNPPVVVDQDSWLAAIAQANANGSSHTTITIGCPEMYLDTAVFLNANVTILGQQALIASVRDDRILFIAGGNVNIQDVTISGGKSTGGTGADGGGGGAGLGGAIFIGSGTYASGDGSAPVTGISAPNVSLTNVSFSDNLATGGQVSPVSSGEAAVGGGGGGLGGNGVGPYPGDHSGGGGGGGISSFQDPASGGSYSTLAPATGMFGLDATGGAGGSGWFDGQPGATGAGGGGGGSTGSLSYDAGGGGGGGVNGGRGYYQNDDYPNGGGAGGFGGGGGGSTAYYGGAGGYGGGGGGGGLLFGGAGGFGGGGGSGGVESIGGAGGFGASDGGNLRDPGGYGLAAGGAIFVMDGASLTINVTTEGSTSFSSNKAVQSGNGSAYGNDLFLGGNVTLNIATGQTLSLDSLGGAGNTTDPNVASAPSVQLAMVQGGVTLEGGGGLVLTGTSYYSGATLVHAGTLSLAADASEVGTSSVTIGQNALDNASLVLGSGATLNVAGNGQILIAQAANSTGSLTIGSGAGSNGANLGTSTISGGAGTATLIFQQNYAVGSTSTTYQFQNLITGSISVIQNGPGTTHLMQANTYTGGTMVKQGTLLVSAMDEIGSGAVQISEGTLSVAAGVAISNAVEITGGGTFEVGLNQADVFAGVPVVTSNFGNGRSTTCQLLQGEASLATTLQISCSTSSAATNDWMRCSDSYSITGVNNLFVLQLTMENAGPGAFLGWYNPYENLWINAVNGTSFHGPTTYIEGAFNPETDTVIGYYGYDVATGSAWAVLDQTGDFAIVPEPSTWAMLLAGGVATALRRRQGNGA